MFNLYARFTKGGGAVIKSSGAGGATTATSSSGGGVSTSTASGGGTSQTSSAGGDHTHKMFTAVGYAENLNPSSSVILAAANGHGIMANDGTSAGLEYYTQGSSGNHSHSVSIPNHTHSFNVPNHSHNVQIPSHSHEINLPAHEHEMEYGIHQLDHLPSKVTIKVDGNTVPYDGTSGHAIDIIPYLAKDQGGRITRGTWHEVTLTPNDLGRINANIVSQLFVVGHTGGTF